MKLKRKNRKRNSGAKKQLEILAPQYKNLMFEKKVRRGCRASERTQQKLGGLTSQAEEGQELPDQARAPAGQDQGRQ